MNASENSTLETHVATGLAAATTYWFAIKAYDHATNYSQVSNSPHATTTEVGDVNGGNSGSNGGHRAPAPTALAIACVIITAIALFLASALIVTETRKPKRRI